jgi:hypothetical protein
MLLENVLGTYVKEIMFKIKSNEIDKEFCDTIEQLTQKYNEGNVILSSVLEDMTEKISLLMVCEKKVKADILRELQKIDKIKNTIEIKFR